MGKDLVTVTLFREHSEENWGFRLAGGRASGQPLSISQVLKGSLAEKVGLSANDFLISVGGKEVINMAHDEAERAIQEAGNRFQMIIQRVNFKKYEKKPADLSASKTLEPADMNKTYNRKDWNCPWVHKDGRGIKQAIRALDEVVAPAKTSFQHYYSEPRSILASEPMLSPEELQELIRQHGAESRPTSSLKIHNGESLYEAEMEAGLQEERMMREDRNSIRTNEHLILQDETYTSQLVNSMRSVGMEHQDNYYTEREVDSQAPPDLEPVSPFPAEMVGDDDCYEPSADELIDVLKNLENLAAANPSLYRSIVSQIKATTARGTVDTSCYSVDAGRTCEESQLYIEQQYGEQLYREQQYGEQQYSEQQYYEEQRQQEYYQENGNVQYEQEVNGHYEQEINGHSAQFEQEAYEQQVYQEESFAQHQSSVKTQSTVVTETEEEKTRRLKLERLEREANEEVRATLQKQRELKMAKLHPPEPPKPKEITVIAGDGKPVRITLGVEKNTEDNRKQVAEAAGLKHIPLPDFDGDMSDSAWAGSLKRTERSKLQHGKQDTQEGGSPWLGSLKHVKGKTTKNQKKEDEDLYGTAPWMGTLRHVVHDNKVTKSYGVNQFQSKRYPDEDATNPFEGQGGIHAQPAYPLTPAAIINGCSLSRNAMAQKEDEEEVERIRGAIKSETVSSALLKALMPKLLKMHESKYPAMDRDEASKIMEEILAMQVGLNVDQQADANEEAEMIIRAIMQDEVGKHVYSKMADDLEAASQRRKKEGKKKKIVKKKEKEGTILETAA